MSTALLVIQYTPCCKQGERLRLRVDHMSAGLASESSSDSEEEDDDNDDDEVEDSEGGEETCPPGCDMGLYDKVNATSTLCKS